MYAFATLTTLLALVAPVIAAPVTRGTLPLDTNPNCDLSFIDLPVPKGGALAIPAGEKISIVTLGRGVQNYTCEGGKWASKGAVANLFNVGCEAAARTNENLLKLSIDAIERFPFPQTGDEPKIEFLHEFVTLDGKASPAFFRAAAPEQRVTGKLTASVPAPVSPETNVAWLQLSAIGGQGDLSKSVFRVGTQGGQPKSPLCNVEGRQLSVPYAAFYYFTK